MLCEETRQVAVAYHPGEPSLFCTLYSEAQNAQQEWNGAFFQKTTLKALGLRVQLGHVDLLCPLPKPAPASFTILDTNGLHTVDVNFCHCDRVISKRQQLLRSGWWPATVHHPQTCVTERCLEQFLAITLTGKLSAYDYYKSLEHLTDNTDMKLPNVSIFLFTSNYC